MANSIRTPRQGNSATSRRIAQAVDDEEWQKFRLSLKGKPTKVKLQMLREYYIGKKHAPTRQGHVDLEGCDICIRVDNYLKALARGGQLTSPMSLEVALDHNWDLQIRK